MVFGWSLSGVTLDARSRSRSVGAGEKGAVDADDNPASKCCTQSRSSIIRLPWRRTAAKRSSACKNRSVSCRSSHHGVAPVPEPASHCSEEFRPSRFAPREEWVPREKEKVKLQHSVESSGSDKDVVRARVVAREAARSARSYSCDLASCRRYIRIDVDEAIPAELPLSSPHADLVSPVSSTITARSGRSLSVDVKISIDEDTDVPLDIYNSLLDAANNACGQHRIIEDSRSRSRSRTTSYSSGSSGSSSQRLIQHNLVIGVDLE
jgi:hypothetical protein